MNLIISIVLILSLVVIGFFVVAVLIQRGMTQDASVVTLGNYLAGDAKII